MAAPSIQVRVGANLDQLKAALESGKSQIESATSAIRRLEVGFSGEKTIRAAHDMSVAIGGIKGVSTLTAAEMAKANRVFELANEKLKALGKEPLPGLHALADATRKVTTETSAANAASQSWLGSVGKMAAGFGLAQLGLNTLSGAWRTFTGFLSSSIASYAAAESADAKLRAALRAHGDAVPQVGAQYKALSEQFQRTTTYGDDLITEMQALLVQVGGVMPADMERGLTAATDLATGLGVDLRTATLLVGKAFAGETATLKRYGIVIDEAKLKTEGITAVLDAVQEKFGGQAQAAIDTYAGSIEQLGNAWDDLKEKIGEAVAQDPLLKFMLRSMNEGLAQNRVATVEAAGGVEAFSLKVAAGSDPIRGTVILLGMYLEGLNALAEAQARLAQMPAPKIFDPKSTAFTISPEVTAELVRILQAWDKGDKAAEQHAIRIKQLHDQAFGLTAIQQAKDYIQAIGGLIGVSKMTADKQAELNRILSLALDAYRALGRDAPSELHKIWLATARLADPALSSGISSNLLSAFRVLPAEIEPKVMESLRNIEGSLAAVPSYVEKVGVAFGKPALTDIPKQIGGWDSAIKGISYSLQTLQTAVSGTFAQMILGAKGFKQGFIDIWNSIKQSILSIFAQILDAFVKQVIGGILAALSGQKGAFGQGLAGLFGGGGMAGGGGGAGFNLGGLFGSSGPLAGGGTVTDPGLLGGALGGGLLAGGAGIGLGFLGKSIFGGAGGKAGAFGAGTGAAAGAAIGSILPGIGTAIGAGIGGLAGLLSGIFGKSKGAKEDTAANQQIQGFQQQLLSTYGSLANIQKLGNQVGIDLAGAFGDKGKKGLQNFQAIMQQFTSQVQALQGVTQAFGLSWQDMQTDPRNAYLNTTAADLAKQITVATSAGFDFDAVLRKTAATWSTLIDGAIESGATIPAEVQPILQRLIEMGLLIDANGNAITDLGKIHFAAAAQAASTGLSDIEKAALGLQKTIGNTSSQAVVDLNVLKNDGLAQIYSSFGTLTSAAVDWGTTVVYQADAASQALQDTYGWTQKVAEGASPGGFRGIIARAKEAGQAIIDDFGASTSTLKGASALVNGLAGPGGSGAMGASSTVNHGPIANVTIQSIVFGASVDPMNAGQVDTHLRSAVPQIVLDALRTNRSGFRSYARQELGV